MCYNQQGQNETTKEKEGKNMNTLCKKGVHIALTYGTEEGKKPTEYRVYRTCVCETKKKYLYGGEYVTDETLTKLGNF